MSSDGNGRIPSSGEWSFPDVVEGDFVMVGVCPSSQDRCLAIVTKRKARGVDVLVISTLGFTARRNCWHQHDPRCVSHGHVFEQGDRGVFELTRGEFERRELLQRVNGLEQLVEEQVERIASLAATAAKPSTEKKKTRKG